MTGNKKKLVIVGDGETAELAHSYFTVDSQFEVVGFAAEEGFRHNKELFGLPVVAFEEIEQIFEPKQHYGFVAISYTNLNRLRSRLFLETKRKGYPLCSYISSRAYVAPDVKMGDNCFILENATVQRGAKIGDDVTIWSGSAVGHSSSVGDNCFLATHVAVSGLCEVGDYSFLGVNSCTVGAIKIGKNCVVGAGAVVTADAAAGLIYVGNPAKALPNRNTDVFIEGVATI